VIDEYPQMIYDGEFELFDAGDGESVQTFIIYYQ
jgi:hypothetical protein